jgi:hypothetical protein
MKLRFPIGPMKKHIAAQSRGKEVWYESYSVQIATITREYGGDVTSTGRQ